MASGFGGIGTSVMGGADYGAPYPKKGKIQKSWFVKSKLTAGFGKPKKPSFPKGSKKTAAKNNWSKGPNLRYKSVFPNAG